MMVLRELREKRGLTLEQVAEKLDLRNQYVSNYELGKRKPDYDTLSKFADFYGVTVDYLLGREQKETAPTPESEREIGLDDFTYAFNGEVRELTESDKQLLLSMARQLNEARKQRDGKKTD